METEKIKSDKRPPRKRFSEFFKKKVVAEFERGFLNKDQLQLKYGLGGHSTVLKWCRKYGRLHYAQKGELGRPMKDPQKQRIKDLEKQLADAKLQITAYQKLIAITEAEEKVSILKKDAAKQSVGLPKHTQEK